MAFVVQRDSGADNRYDTDIADFSDDVRKTVAVVTTSNLAIITVTDVDSTTAITLDNGEFLTVLN